MNLQTNYHLTWDIVGTKAETPTVTTLVLRPRGEMPHYIPGQYLTVLLPGFEPEEGKSYSIASIPSDPYLSLTVRAMSGFSRALREKHVGDTLLTTSPYGFFYPEEPVQEMVLLAGGIGIVPLMSIARGLFASGNAELVTLLYSNRTSRDVVYHGAITELVGAHENFSVEYFFTRDEAHSENSHTGRITDYPSLFSRTSYDSTSFFICGSMAFTRDIWKMLRSLGVPHTALYTEGFF
jgi:ferredoxin-NADP reductase